MNKKYTPSETFDNILNANENARKKEELEKKNARLRVLVPVVSAASAVTTGIFFFGKTIKHRREAERELELLREKTEKLEKALNGETTFTEIMEEGDLNG